MIKDMQFNLAPITDVYKDSNPEVEETIACIEALARVPQQVMKWGYLTTMATMQGLYRIYYNEVIPSLITNYELMTQERYKRDLSKSQSLINLWHRFNIFRRKQRAAPVREI